MAISRCSRTLAHPLQQFYLEPPVTGCDYSLMACFRTPEKAAFYRRIESAKLFPRTPSRRESAFARSSWKQRLPFVSHSLHAPEGTAQTRIMTYWSSLLALWLSPWRHECHSRSTQRYTEVHHQFKGRDLYLLQLPKPVAQLER